MAEPDEFERSTASKSTINRRPSNLKWLIPAVVVIVFAAGGFLIGRLFGTRGSVQTASGAEAHAPAKPASSKPAAHPPGAGESWYYNLDPIVVNLNEPGVTRYVRVSLTLEVSGALAEKEGRLFLDQKKPLMKHRLTLFLANQTIEDMRGERNLVRMQTQISDLLNNGLFPGDSPQIKSVLLQEFAIQ
jgi:flagellar basal body-associated protein FliL